MSGIYLLQFFLGIAIAFFQQTAPTNPYRAVENWAKLPAGMEWGQVSGVELDAHGNLWVIHRTDPPILEFDPSGNLLKSFGSGMFVQPHSLHFDRDCLAAAAKQRVRITDDDTWSDIFSKILVEHVEPNLGQGRLTILFEYPVPEAALARLKPSEPRLAERFEVYACGVELANGFGELIDAREQRVRFTQAMDEKERRYGERYPLDEELLRAIAVMPEASGVALGFDRLVMLASGALRIDQVVWTPPAGDG